MQNENISVKKNYIYNFTFQIAMIFVPLITTPYVSRVLGADNIGQYSYATAIVTFFSTAAIFGSTTYGQRTIAFYRDNKEKVSEVFWNIVAFRLITSIIAIILYFLLLYTIEGITAIKILVCLNIVSVAVDISWFFQGIELFKETVLRSIFVKILSTILIFSLVHKNGDTLIYILTMLGSIIIGNAVLWLYIPKLISKPKSIHPFSGFKDMWLVFVPTIATQVYMILDKSMIGWITKSNYQNGCYEQSEIIARQLITLVTSVGAVILPRVANLYHKNRLDEAKEYVYKAYHVVYILALPLTFGMIGISSIFIPVYLGNGYDLSIVLFKIFSLLVLSVSLAYVSGFSYLIPTNQQNVYTFSVSIAAVVNFSLNSILIPRYGAIGAAIASVIAEALGTTIQIMYCINKKQLKASRIFEPSIKCLIASVVMYISLLSIKTFVSSEIKGVIACVLSSVVIYLILLILLRDSLVISTIKRFKEKLHL